MKFLRHKIGLRMYVRTILYVLSKVQGLFNLRRIRKATILYQGQSLSSG
jgi:hypothetical protein